MKTYATTCVTWGNLAEQGRSIGPTPALPEGRDVIGTWKLLQTNVVPFPHGENLFLYSWTWGLE